MIVDSRATTGKPFSRASLTSPFIRIPPSSSTWLLTSCERKELLGFQTCTGQWSRFVSSTRVPFLDTAIHVTGMMDQIIFAALEKMEIKYNRKIVPRMDLMPNTELAIYAERWRQRGSEPSSTHPTPWLVLAESSFLEFGIVAARVEIWRRDYKQIFKILRLCTLCRAALQLFCFQHYHLQHSLCTRFKIKVNCDTNCNSVKIKIN
jgi:hypothetical protein